MLKKIINILTSRPAIIAMLLIVQLIVLFSVVFTLSEYFVSFYFFLMFLSVVMSIYVINKDDNPNYKLTWVMIKMCIRDRPEVDVKMMIDVKQMERVIDNIRSNLMKYASKAIEIEITINTRFQCLIRNGYQVKNEAESNRIGLKSIEKIMKVHNGYLEVHFEETYFELLLYLPIIKEEGKSQDITGC